MSSTLHWRPTNHDGESLGDPLKFILRKRFGDGSISDWTEIGTESLDFLDGVLATVNDKQLAGEVKALVALIEKHGTIEVREVY